MDCDLLLAEEQRGIIQEDDTTHSTETVADTFGTLNNFDHTRARIVQLGSVVGTPALALESDAIIHQQDTTTVHPLDHRLSDSTPGANRANTRDSFQELRQGGSPSTIDRLVVDGSRLLELRSMALACRHFDLRDDLRILLQL